MPTSFVSLLVMTSHLRIGVEQNQYQDNLRGQEFLHINLERIHVQGIQIQVQEFLAGKSRENFYFYELMSGINLSLLNSFRK